MDNRYLAAGGVGALVIAAIVAAFFFLMPKTAQTEANTGDPTYVAALAPKPTDNWMGDPTKAPIKFVEYASSGCPHCAAFALAVLPELKKKWIDTGKVAYVLRDYPLDDVAAEASMIARCVPKDQFYPFMDILFGNQAQWHVQGVDPKEALISLSRRAGLSREQVESCLKDQAMLDRINASRDEAVDKLKVNSTPTLFINGERIEGAVPLVNLEEKFKALLPADGAKDAKSGSNPS